MSWHIHLIKIVIYRNRWCKFQDDIFEAKWDMNTWIYKWIWEKLFKFLPANWPSNLTIAHGQQTCRNHEKRTKTQTKTWKCFAKDIQILSSSEGFPSHYSDVIMGTIVSQITSLTIVYSTVYSDADQRKHQSSVSLAFVRGIHLGLVNSPHKWPVTRKMFPFDDVIMNRTNWFNASTQWNQ